MPAICSDIGIGRIKCCTSSNSVRDSRPCEFCREIPLCVCVVLNAHGSWYARSVFQCEFDSKMPSEAEGFSSPLFSLFATTLSLMLGRIDRNSEYGSIAMAVPAPNVHDFEQQRFNYDICRYAPHTTHKCRHIGQSVQSVNGWASGSKRKKKKNQKHLSITACCAPSVSTLYYKTPFHHFNAPCHARTHVLCWEFFFFFSRTFGKFIYFSLWQKCRLLPSRQLTLGAIKQSECVSVMLYFFSPPLSPMLLSCFVGVCNCVWCSGMASVRSIVAIVV